jgi:hypothetical protein
MKTSELTGAALDWAVAKCEGYFDIDMAVVRNGTTVVHYFDKWQPSTDWSLSGPIIEREGITTAPRKEHGKRVAWVATLIEPPAVCECEGKTQLIAAMRCFVASRLGDTVNIPEELRGE